MLCQIYILTQKEALISLGEKKCLFVVQIFHFRKTCCASQRRCHVASLCDILTGAHYLCPDQVRGNPGLAGRAGKVPMACELYLVPCCACIFVSAQLGRVHIVRCAGAPSSLYRSATIVRIASESSGSAVHHCTLHNLVPDLENVRNFTQAVFSFEDFTRRCVNFDKFKIASKQCNLSAITIYTAFIFTHQRIILPLTSKIGNI